MPDIMHLFKFAVPRGQAYQAIATADGVRKWWTNDADREAFAGGHGEFRFYGGQSVHKVNVVESVLPQRIVWDVRGSFRQEWVGTNIVFSLRPDDNGTELLFAHRGFLKADEACALFTKGWGHLPGQPQAALGKRSRNTALMGAAARTSKQAH